MMPILFPVRPPDPELLERWLAGACSPHDAARVQRWIDADPKRRQTALGLKALDMADGSTVITDLDALWHRVVGRVRERSPGAAGDDRALHVVPVSRSLRWSLRWPLRRIALFSLITAILAIPVGTWLVRSHRTPPPVLQYYTAPGQRATVRLAHGSTMILAPSTMVTAAPSGIAVTGEAYFMISPNSTHPFVVRTQNAEVRVLGTRFAVRQYPSERTSRIIVDDGKVALRPQWNRRVPIVLTSRMMAQVADSGVAVQRGIATRDYTSWTHGMLIFDKVALQDVVTELVRAYGADIRVIDTVLAKQRMTLEISVSEQPLTQILDLISEASGAHYSHDGPAYILSSGRRATQTPQAPPSYMQRHRFPQPEKQYGK
jgi:ferric-dicitrate binding protein FerR (iron transport regulator)